MTFDIRSYNPGSNNSNTGRIDFYQTADDQNTVAADGYFNEIRNMVKSGYIMVVFSTTDDNHVAYKIEIDGLTVKTSSTLGDSRSAITGFVDYNDAATASTPISYTGGSGFQKLTNDGAGPFTNKNCLPPGITDIWDTTNNRFDWGELKLCDMIDIRLDCEITTTSNNQEVDINLYLAVGGSEYPIPFIAGQSFKFAGAHQVNRYNGIYMGNTDTLNNYGEFRVSSPDNCTIKVNGWYCKIIQSGITYAGG